MDLKAGTQNVTACRFAAWTTATGAAVTVTSATVGLALWYKRAGGAKVPLASVNDLATEDAAYNAQGIKVVSGQIHRIDLPDAAFVAGATHVEWGGEATGITIDGGVANLIGQANTSTDMSHSTGVVPGDKGGLPITDAATGLILTGFDGGEMTVANVTLVDTLTTYTGNTLQTADVGTRLPQVVSMAQVGGSGAYYVVALGSVGTGAGQFSLESGVIAASGHWAVAGDTMALAPGSITANAFDGSTAYPLAFPLVWMHNELGDLPVVDIQSIWGNASTGENLNNFFNGTGYEGGTICLKVDVQTVKGRAVTDVGVGNTVYLGVSAWGTSTLTAQQVWEYATRTLSAFSFTVAATGDWTTDADITALLSTLATTHGAGSWATATGFALASDWTSTRAGYLDAAITTRQATITNLGAIVTDWSDGGRLDLILDGILEDTGTTLPTAIDAVPTVSEIDTQLSGTHGAGTWASSGAGTGTRAVTFTVTTGGVALQGASIRLYRTGSNDRTGSTNSSGQVTLYCDVDATWSYIVTHALYSSASGTVVVDGNETVPVSMTSISWPTSTVTGTTTVRWRVRKTSRAWAGAAECTVYMGISKGPGVSGTIYNGDNLDYDSDATDADGYVYFANTPKGATVAVKTTTDGQVQFVKIPSDCGDTFDGLELIGSS